MSFAALTWPGWMRPSFVTLFVATLFLNLWGLDRYGWVTASYPAAVRRARAWKLRPKSGKL